MVPQVMHIGASAEMPWNFSRSSADEWTSAETSRALAAPAPDFTWSASSALPSTAGVEVAAAAAGLASFASFAAFFAAALSALAFLASSAAAALAAAFSYLAYFASAFLSSALTAAG